MAKKPLNYRLVEAADQVEKDVWWFTVLDEVLNYCLTKPVIIDVVGKIDGGSNSGGTQTKMEDA